MKLYVCFGTFKNAPRPGGHPCGNSYWALKDAGYEPEVKKSYGLAILPDAFNQSEGRKEVKARTGSNMVPMLLTEDDQVVHGSHEIVDWAKSHPAAG